MAGLLEELLLNIEDPENRPDRVDLAVMEKIIKDGNFSKPLITDINSTHRVYIPLVTKKPCLACHGDNIEPKTKEEITKRYPKDWQLALEMVNLEV